MSYSLAELAARTATRVAGDPEHRIEGVGTLGQAGPHQISFLSNPRYRRQLAATQAGAVILSEADLPHCPVNALVGSNPYVVYARVAALFVAPDEVEPGIHPTAVIHAGARIHSSAAIGAHVTVGEGTEVGAGAIVGPGCVVARHCRIGEHARLVANVTVYEHCEIGQRVLIHAGAVIGSDGFGFAKDQGRWVKVPQLGRVVIGDDVEVGACTTIDRGAIEDTVIEEGVKLDNQIQVAHNVRIGAHTAMAGCVGVAGSTRIGRNCAIGGGVGILGHIEIADGVTITPTSLVTKSIKEPGVYSSGVPLEPIDHWQKNFARFKHLDEMARRLRELEKEVHELKKQGSPS